MSTPRTDAAKFQSSQDPDVYNVDSEFAAQLETELAEMREELAIEHKSSTYFQSQLSAEREKVARLREVLAFYAGNFPNDDLGNWQERICYDEGDKAREAIEQTK